MRSEFVHFTFTTIKILFLPKAGVLFHPDEETSFYARYFQGFRPQRSQKLEKDRDINNDMKLDVITSEQVQIGAK